MSRRSGARQRVHDTNETSAALYDETARAAAAEVIDRYSTSFGAGTRLLSAPMRAHIKSVYAMVRVADEIVDTYRGDDAGDLLDAFAREVHDAMDRGYSANVVAHAFALTARDVGITRDMTEPFFASMRMDLDVTDHTQASFERYVYGSAEVIGEMCLAVFLNTETGTAPLPRDVAVGARRLGAAYQKVNFLRDLAMDGQELGRSYFPGVTAATLTDERLAELVDDCRADIRAAEACLPALPRSARIGVATTIDIYARLLRQIEATPAHRLVHQRVRVADPIKLALAVRNAVPWLAHTRRTA